MFGRSQGQTLWVDNPARIEALNRLTYVAEQREPFVLLRGTAGTGRTSVLLRLQERFGSTHDSAVMFNVSGMDEQTLLQQVCRSLAVTSTPSATNGTLMSAIRDEISGRVQCRSRTILILDDLDRSREDLTPAVLFFCAVNQQTEHGITVVAAAEDSPGPKLEQLSALNVELQDLDRSESQEFASAVLQASGVDPSELDSSGLAAITRFGKGSPSRLKKLCEIVSVAVRTTPDLCVTENIVDVLVTEMLLKRAG